MDRRGPTRPVSTWSTSPPATGSTRFSTPRRTIPFCAVSGARRCRDERRRSRGSDRALPLDPISTRWWVSPRASRCATPAPRMPVCSRKDRLDLVELGATPDRPAALTTSPTSCSIPQTSRLFPDLATAHAATANRVHRGIGINGVPLVVCPTLYWGDGDEEYISRLAADLDPRIDLFWTGTGGLLTRHHRRRGGSLRPGQPSPASLLGQLPGQRCGDGERDAHRALPEP